ncbi:MAG: tryptophan-rich sensory protein [Oscillospiraceae bacterium]
MLVALLTKRFYKIVPKAGYLFLPYLIWTTFALYLNIGVYFLN